MSNPWFVITKYKGKQNYTAHRRVDCSWMNKRNHPYPKKISVFHDLGPHTPCMHCAFEDWVEHWESFLSKQRGLDWMATRKWLDSKINTRRLL